MLGVTPPRKSVFYNYKASDLSKNVLHLFLMNLSGIYDRINKTAVVQVAVFQ